MSFGSTVEIKWKYTKKLAQRLNKFQNKCENWKHKNYCSHASMRSPWWRWRRITTRETEKSVSRFFPGAPFLRKFSNVSHSVSTKQFLVWKFKTEKLKSYKNFFDNTKIDFREEVKKKQKLFFNRAKSCLFICVYDERGGNLEKLKYKTRKVIPQYLKLTGRVSNSAFISFFSSGRAVLAKNATLCARRNEREKMSEDFLF